MPAGAAGERRHEHQGGDLQVRAGATQLLGPGPGTALDPCPAIAPGRLETPGLARSLPRRSGCGAPLGLRVRSPAGPQLEPAPGRPALVSQRLEMAPPSPRVAVVPTGRAAPGPAPRSPARSPGTAGPWRGEARCPARGPVRGCLETAGERGCVQGARRPGPLSLSEPVC